MQKIQLLYAIGGAMDRGGIPIVVMQYIRALKKTDRFDIAVLTHGDAEGDFDRELQENGVRMYKLPRRGAKPLTYGKRAKDFFRTHRFDIVHCHMDASSGLFLQYAKESNVKIRIAHAHTTRYLSKNPLKNLLNAYSKRMIPQAATDLVACSAKVGDWMFGKKDYRVISNAIDTGLFTFSGQRRKEIRNKLGIAEKTFVAGHVGRMAPEKNQKMVLDIFKLYHAWNPDSLLVLIGDGALYEEMVQYAASLELLSAVKFLGNQKNVSEYMQTFDVFLLPSFFEGFPVAGIEAQSEGIPALFSDSITEEVCLLPTARRLGLENITDWTDCLKRISVGERYPNAEKIVAEKGFDLDKQGDRLLHYYTALMERECP